MKKRVVLYLVISLVAFGCTIAFAVCCGISIGEAGNRIRETKRMRESLLIDATVTQVQATQEMLVAPGTSGTDITIVTLSYFVGGEEYNATFYDSRNHKVNETVKLLVSESDPSLCSMQTNLDIKMPVLMSAVFGVLSMLVFRAWISMSDNLSLQEASR